MSIKMRHNTFEKTPVRRGLLNPLELMKALNTLKVLQLLTQLEQIRVDPKCHSRNSIPNSAKPVLKQMIDIWDGICEEAQLPMARITVKKLREECCDLNSQGTFFVYGALCLELQNRIGDEMTTKSLLMLDQEETEYYSKPLYGWEKIVSRFPSVRDDAEEARKCFALSRYSASVYHSTQIVEAGLLELGRFINVTDPHSGWTAVSRELKKILDKNRNDMSTFEKSNHKFLEQAHGTIEALKNAWRNKIDHAQGRLVLMTKEFSPEIAEEILFATRAFMRRLMEGLPHK